MAKKDIRIIAKQLADKYSEAEEVMQEAGLLLQDTVLGPEEQKRFSEHKAAVDNELALLSVALSAAAQGKIKELIDKAEEEHQSFLEPLHQAADNLAEELPAETKLATFQLIQNYNRQILKIQDKINLLNKVARIANFPNKRSNQKKYARRKGITFYSIKDQRDMFFAECDVFVFYECAMSSFRRYIKSLSEEEQSTAGYLDE